MVGSCWEIWRVVSKTLPIDGASLQCDIVNKMVLSLLEICLKQVRFTIDQLPTLTVCGEDRSLLCGSLW